MSYAEFLEAKMHVGGNSGFKATYLPDCLFDFQSALVEWATLKGRAAVFADCGLGKTFIQLAWAENVVRKTNGRVLILAPLAVGFQTVTEGEKLGLKLTHDRDGTEKKARLVVSNYERLHYFDPKNFTGVVCDESSILKNFDGKTRLAITQFMRKLQYRLLCTATAAPNDYIELGTSSEAIGEMGFSDMLSRFFKKVERTMSRRDEHQGCNYRFRGHAERDFWRWVCSWARAMRRPSDLGYDDAAFRLPPLVVRDHFVKANSPAPGMLFEMPAIGLQEQREELRRTLKERCEQAAELANSHSNPVVVWCHLNPEGQLLKKMIPDAQEVKGSDTDERKESTFRDFALGNIRVLVTKPKIGAFGLNWQHCSNVVYFPSHSYEQYYQAVRRCWRFGQRNTVKVDVVATEGQRQVLDNLKRKADAASAMFEQLVGMMRNELRIERKNEFVKKEEVPTWL